jgi:hypothetical protein
VLPLTVDVAIESEQFGDSFPPDPADRLVAATARVYNLTLITSDRSIRKSGAVRTLWETSGASWISSSKRRLGAYEIRGELGAGGVAHGASWPR